jgi:hypothetical protein
LACRGTYRRHITSIVFVTHPRKSDGQLMRAACNFLTRPEEKLARWTSTGINSFSSKQRSYRDEGKVVWLHVRKYIPIHKRVICDITTWFVCNNPCTSYIPRASRGIPCLSLNSQIGKKCI